jgi:hypothetical protein
MEVLAALALASAGAAAEADDGAVDRPLPVPAVTRPADGGGGAPNAREPSAPGAPGTNGPRIEVASATVTTEAPATPGATVTLSLNFDPARWSRFHWTQVEGAPVKIDNPSTPSIRVVIPPGDRPLEFVCVATNTDVIRVVRVLLPIQDGTTPPAAAQGTGAAGPAAPPRGSGKLKADAGDDQAGLVGHRVTLNGSKSTASDEKGVRWVQLSGPVIVAPERQGRYFSFIPSAPGVYRFALLVAAGGEISEPDEVSVLVGLPPGAPATSASPFNPMATQPGAPPWAVSPDQILASTLPRLPGSTRVAGEVADVLESISERTNLYSSFGVLQSELSRRLDLVIPGDPAQRTSWIQDVFLPLTGVTANELLPTGIDIRVPQGVQQVLTPAQQGQIREHLQRLARAFRAAADRGH